MNPNQALDILKSKGIDTGSILNQLDSEGYDISSIVPKESLTMNPNGFMNNLKMAGKIFLGGSQQDPTNTMAQTGANKTGEDIATSKFGQKFPEIGAGIGTAVQMSPTLASLAVGLPEAKAAAESGELGMAGRVISGPSRTEAGAAQGFAERLGGINTDYEPTLKTMSQKLGLPKGTTTKDYLNTLMDHIRWGREFTADEAYQHKKLIGSILDKENTGLMAKLGLGNEKTIGKSAVALASRIGNYLNEVINSQVPGRAEQASNYMAALMRNKIYGTAAGAAAAYSGSPIIKAILKHSSGQ